MTFSGRYGGGGGGGVLHNQGSVDMPMMTVCPFREKGSRTNHSSKTVFYTLTRHVHILHHFMIVVRGGWDGTGKAGSEWRRCGKN